MVERGVFVAPPGAPSVTLRPVAHGVEASVAETLDAALGGRLIDAGADVLPLAPGVVIAPEPDRRLRRAGIAVISVRGVSPRSACCAVLRPLPAPERRCE